MTDFETTQADAPADAGGAVIEQSAPVTQEAPVEAPKEYDPNEFYKDDKPKVDHNTPAEEDAPDDDAAAEPVEETQAEPIEAPVSWSKDYKAQFESLPREMQEIISTREKERETFLQSKSREASQTRQAVETEARTALQTIMNNHQQQLQQYASRFEVQPPDARLLQSGDPEHMRLYMQQEAAYRDGTAQREQLTQQAREAQQHAEAIASQQQQVELQAEHALLEDKLGNEWADPSLRAKLLGELTPIAAELGYSPELIAQARASDILAMKNVAALKADADKWRAYNKAKMVPVRAARNAPIPPAARPGAPAGNRQPTSTVELLYPNDVRRN